MRNPALAVTKVLTTFPAKKTKKTAAEATAAAARSLAVYRPAAAANLEPDDNAQDGTGMGKRKERGERERVLRQIEARNHDPPARDRSPIALPHLSASREVQLLDSSGSQNHSGSKKKKKKKRRLADAEIAAAVALAVTAVEAARPLQQRQQNRSVDWASGMDASITSAEVAAAAAANISAGGRGKGPGKAKNLRRPRAVTWLNEASSPPLASSAAAAAVEVAASPTPARKLPRLESLDEEVEAAPAAKRRIAGVTLAKPLASQIRRMDREAMEVLGERKRMGRRIEHDARWSKEANEARERAERHRLLLEGAREAMAGMRTRSRTTAELQQGTRAWQEAMELEVQEAMELEVQQEADATLARISAQHESMYH
jgi:hypothetical protein